MWLWHLWTFAATRPSWASLSVVEVDMVERSWDVHEKGTEWRILISYG
jgi:hypothetical protein